MSTIKAVAKEAGVSITTVSRVMNKRGYISEETYKKVYAAIEKLDYHPNFSAKSLSTQRSNVIGLILPNSVHPFFGEMILYIEKYAFERGYMIMFCNSVDNIEKERAFIQMLREKRVDGLIMGSHNLDTKAYTSVKEPIVTFERFINNRVPYVTCDNYTGGIMATRHLIEKGCQSLLYISSTLELDIYSNQRLSGFKSVCEQEGVKHEVIERDDFNLDYPDGSRFIKEDIAQKINHYDGVFCSSDMMGHALYDYCKQTGIDVPGDLKIIGFDYDIFTRNISEPRLTTIAQPIDKICEALVVNLIKVIEGQDDIMNVQLGVDLVEGSTT